MCGEPISASSSLHQCDSEKLPLSFYYTKLTESSRSVHFYDRPSGHGFLHEIKVWTNGYINGIELKFEDLRSKKFFQIRRGQNSGKLHRFGLESGEFVQKVQFGCDFHGMYYIAFFSNKKSEKIGDLERPFRTFEFPDGFGLVGLFGGFTDKILHLGFYFDEICQVNWARHREILLLRSKGQKDEKNELSLILDLDDQLFRYLASFV
jgi:hypothetical protein